MNLKKTKIIILMTLTILTCNLNFVSAFECFPPKSISQDLIKDLDLIDNNMYILINTILKDQINEDSAKQQIRILDSLIKNLNSKASTISTKDDTTLLAIKAILSFYKVSLIKSEDFLKTKNQDDLVNAVSSFSVGYNSSTTLRKIISDSK
ncbi:hypothetical protein ACOV1W_06120 [Paraclostridium bifermentans]|uniref:Uncharacterized protein n=1 Tax=Paraclostridium bifermentans TaxID=1490 RepID=A0AA44DLM3_PARBF|nr:hypothetical protein [Paraclostridium bifermentans]MBN8047418.1 hypothetical protein [Paraclostridium bifermentans]NME09979.1 hypothetical protein [Paraclostridium bifermentans]